MNWTEHENGWIMDISECTGFMPKGEPIPPLELGWKIFRDPDGDILKWVYTYADGKTATLFND